MVWCPRSPRRGPRRRSLVLLLLSVLLGGALTTGAVPAEAAPAAPAVPLAPLAPVVPAAPAAPAPAAPAVPLAPPAPVVPAAPAAPAPAVPGAFVPLQAARLFDSRDAGRVVDRGFATAPGPLGPGQTVGVPVAGRGGVPDVGAGTVVLNITGTTLFGSSYLTLWPQGAPRPPTSTLSLAPSVPVTKTVVTKLGNGGAVSLFNVSGLTDTTVDVVGWFPEASPLVSGVPQRLLDTRQGPPTTTVDGQEIGGGPLGPGEARTVRVDGRGFAPAPPGSSVLLNLVGTDATEPTSVTAWPAGGAKPLAPSLTLQPDETLPNMTIVAVGEGGAISLANESGQVDVLADVVAVVPPAVGRAVAPARLFDTRAAAPTADGTAAGSGPLTPGATRTVPVAGRGGVPARGVSSVLLEVTGITPRAAGAIGVWGAGPPPTTSAVVVPAGQVRPGFAVVPVSPEGTVQIAAAGSAMDAAVDVVGWLAGVPAAATGAAAAPGAPGAGGVPAPDGGKVLWQADFADGLAGFRSTPWNIVGATTPGVVGSVLGGRRPAVQFSMPGGGQRAEIEPNFRSLREGDDLWFGFSVTLAPGFPATTDDWQVITQWKNDGTGSPPLSIKVGKGQFLLDGGFGGGAAFQVPLGAATVGQPHRVVTHVVFRGGAGSVDTWVDGRQTLRGFRPPAGTLYPGTTSYVKTGIYRNTAIAQPGTLFFDDWRIGTSYAAAFPR